MKRLVHSVSPLQDIKAALSGIEIVLYHDYSEIRILSYCGGNFYIVGHCSIASGTGKDVPDADFYFGGFGYIDDPMMSYACLPEGTPDIVWEDVYRELSAVSVQ